jgi:N-acetylglucosaminyldiphosphoundecaprenol N-acetyl-beta-D-mannosaminyltransferase
MELLKHISGLNIGLMKINIDNIIFDSLDINSVADTIIKKKRILSLVGLHGLSIKDKDIDYLNAINSSDIVIADSVTPTIIAKLQGKKLKRIPGPDLMNFILSKYELRNYFYGDTEECINAILDKKNGSAGYSPAPNELSIKENIDRINAYKPDILWVGLGCPKQEKWINENKDKLNAKCIIGVGAAFKFYSNTVKRSPKIFRKLGIEWIYRLICEPKRIYPRLLSGICYLIRYYTK